MTGTTGTLRVAATGASGALVLRPWRTSDAQTVIEAYGDPEISRWTTKPIAGRADALRWLDIQRRGTESGTRLSFAVCAAHERNPQHAERLERLQQAERAYSADPADARDSAARADQVQPQGGTILGNISLRWSEASGPEAAEVGYWVMAHARGQGVAPRAVEALSTWALENFAGDGLRRIKLIHQVDNLASCRVAAKTGYHFERILPAEPPYPRDGHLHVREAG
ncbi:GNAT family N-acetyltransferase [Streptomyces sp. NPDC006691]|uniref:GNAT family N-acetyltransferase n=1 Tax=Streptomyces sp. NPDC006691 TaxID=3364757 RepID=UPI003690D520